MMVIPIGLRNAIETGNTVLFLGAGIGAHLFKADGSNAPTGDELAKELAEHFHIDNAINVDLPTISQFVEIKFGRAELISFLHKILGDLEPDEKLAWLFQFRWKAIFTTNYDRGIQRCYEKITSPVQTPVTISTSSQIKSHNPLIEVPIYHIHGALHGNVNYDIIISQNDYSRFKKQREMLFNILKTDFATSTFLYIGYSNRDPNWKMLLEEVRTEFFPSTMPISYRLDPMKNEIEIEILESQGIKTLSMTYEQFYQAGTASISIVKDNLEQMRKIKEKIPPDFAKEFDKNPAALTRLLNSWSYVNQENFSEKPNINDFLKGAKPNWSLISNNIQFERDIEEQVFDFLLDYTTGLKGGVRLGIIISPAGYGISTLLMKFASESVKERIGSVWFHRVGSLVLEGDIEYACTISRDRPIFFIDQAADQAINLKSSIQRIKELKKDALLILGERINEWRQSDANIGCNEFLLEPLSDPEINRLLDCLDKNQQLGVLEPLKRELQFSAIKNVYNKELLVALREATEGKDFDAILLNEYYGIKDDLSKRAYLIVCCFYQYGIFIRDNLLAELLDTPLEDLYKAIEKTTEGILEEECIDQANQSYALRARHRIIAEVIWIRCGLLDDQEFLIQKAIESLNLFHKIDRDAFEHFIRSDRLIDSIRTVDGRIKFFEEAIKKEPDNPYTKQHYARMLARANHYSAALSQIEDAIREKPEIKVLYHTRGLIQHMLAITEKNDEIARRRLVQSESSFKKCIQLKDRSGYAYSGLAKLYREWSLRASTNAEASDYLAKAESVISEGLRIVRDKESLWIESSEIQKMLGDHPGYVESLVKAVKESSKANHARYLLGRSYRLEGKYEDAIEILYPIIENDHQDFRSYIEYTQCLLLLQHSYDEAISTLSLSNLYGLSDCRYIATLGGILFLNGKFTESKKIFNETYKRHFRAPEIDSIYFIPPDPIDPKKTFSLQGVVVEVKAGFSLIQTMGYPSILCPGSKYKGLLLGKGMRIDFSLGFRPKGPVAFDPKEI